MAQAKSMQCNIGSVERSLSAIAGGMLLGVGMTQRRAVGLLSLVLGGGFLLRAISGYCPVQALINRQRRAPEAMVPAEALDAYPRLDVSRQATPRMRDEPSTKSKDTVVEEASMESFPASDPPSWVV